MNLKTTILVLVASLALLLAPMALGQTTSPPYLSQFPSLERIKADVKGVDAMETAAKQAGIFWQLRQLIYDLALSQRRTDRQFTPDEQRLEVEYRNAHYKAIEPFEGKVTGGDKPKWFELRGKYERDLWLRDEVFKKYFTPDLRRTVYVALKGEAPTQAPPPGSTLGPSASSPPASSTAAPTDPSIAKATAAKVDTTVFGWQLGETLRLPECPLVLLDLEANCYSKGSPLGVDPATGLEYRVGGAVVRVLHLTAEDCPSWIPNCVINGMFRDSKLVGIFIYTSGRDVEKSTNDELRAKYGPPTRIEVGTITPDVGNAFETKNPEWMFPGLHVQYQVIRLAENGRVNLNEGIVWIETESTYQARMAARTAPVKREL